MKTTSSTNIGKNISWSGIKNHMKHDPELDHKNKFLETEESKKLRKFNQHFDLLDFKKEVKNYMKPFVIDQQKKLKEKAHKQKVDFDDSVESQELAVLKGTLNRLSKGVDLPNLFDGAYDSIKNLDLKKRLKIKEEIYQKNSILTDPEAYMTKTLKGAPRKNRLDRVCVAKFSNEQDWEKMKDVISKRWPQLRNHYGKALATHKIENPDEFCAYMASRSLETYMKNFNERNGKFIKAFSADVHVDEKGSPHVHYRALAMPDDKITYTKSGAVKAPHMAFSAGVRAEMEAKYSKTFNNKTALVKWREQEDKALFSVFQNNFEKLMGKKLEFYRKTEKNPDLTVGLAHDEYIRQKKTADADFMTYRQSLLDKREVLDKEAKRQAKQQKQLDKQKEDFEKNKQKLQDAENDYVTSARYRGRKYVKAWAKYEVKHDPTEYAKNSDLWYLILTKLCMMSPEEAMRYTDRAVIFDKTKNKEDFLEF